MYDHFMILILYYSNEQIEGVRAKLCYLLHFSEADNTVSFSPLNGELFTKYLNW